MIEAAFHRKSFAIAAMMLLQFLLPPLIAIASLAAGIALYDGSFTREHGVLLSLVAVLSMLLLQSPRNGGSQLVQDSMPLVFSLLARWGLMMFILLFIGYATKFSEQFSRVVMFTWALFTPVLLIIAGLGLRQAMRRLLHDPSAARKAVIAGYNETSQSLAARLANPEFGTRVVGFFDDRGRERLQATDETVLLGTLSELAGFVRQRAIDVIFIALPIRHLPRVISLLEDLRDSTASIYYLPDLFVFDLIQARTADIAGIPIVAMCETPFYGYRGVTKRLFDVVLASICLVMLAPLMLGLILLVKGTSPGSAIFRQRRYGLDGREIQIYKFRTMVVTEDGDQIRQASREDVRVTRVGRFLRRWSLDELPQLINVLQGRMSLVGPRPHAVAHNEQYRKLISGYMIRHKVLPGITGLAQVNGCRGETSRLEEMQSRINYDLEYLRSWTPMLDVKILFWTLLNASGRGKAY